MDELAAQDHIGGGVLARQPPHRWLRGVIMDAAMNET